MLLMFAAGALLSLVGFVLGPVIRLALSRRRESLADAGGVELSRNPAGLLSALRKLQGNDKPLPASTTPPPRCASTIRSSTTPAESTACSTPTRRSPTASPRWNA
jgi:Zn-dependent protease with chaperone function